MSENIAEMLDDPKGRQLALNALYRDFREAGDDVMNADLRLADFANATMEELAAAKSAFILIYGEEEDEEDDS